VPGCGTQGAPGGGAAARLGVSRSPVWTTLARAGYVLPASARRPRGFAALDPERRGALGRKGGRAAARKPWGESRRGRPPDKARRAAAGRRRAAGLTLAEIGRRLGVTRQAVQSMLARAVADGTGAREQGRPPGAAAPRRGRTQ